MRFDHKAFTALAFVALRADGEREFLFFRHPSADMLLTEAELDKNLIQKLAKKLTAVDLVAIVGTTIGAGVYIIVETVARQHTGPALAVSFFIAGVAAALSACCYVELASCCPSAGSAYHYAYIFSEKGMY
ncbi:hypothetical protein Bca52824_065983 [Brassica carinata]|uniref:Uncharacterized protein n=1 Tax=Brassica carinata TaxID=52824 RepID=A0A8X7QPJ9_BRACI|nr:hypothetical protein Bca52824_065983 [Brassica carinata]